MSVHIIDNNAKGVGPNVSLLPIRDCGKGVPCANRNGCYACKFLHRPSVKKAWQDNSRTARNNPRAFFAAIRDYLTRKNPAFFRWHVAGDFLSQEYVDECFAIAREFPDCRFLAFTKRHDFNYRFRPGNFSVVASMWPGWGDEAAVRRQGLPIAWMDDGTESRIPANAMHCPGNCDGCGMCWQLPDIGRDVQFPKH